MEKKEIIEKIKEVRADATERNFTQGFDFVASLKDLDLNNPDHKVDAFTSLPHKTGKDKRVAALVAAHGEGSVS